MVRLAAELAGTFVLVLAGTGAIAADAVSHGRVSHVGVALAFGLAAFAMVEAMGPLSGAHLNPAVSVALALSGRFAWRMVPGYAAAQLAGAFAATLALRAFLPESPTLGETVPATTALRSAVLEGVLTFVLAMTVLRVTADARGGSRLAGAAIGATIAAGVLFAGPVCGGSMNPARSIAPAVVAGRTDELWASVAGPLVGAAIAGAGAGILRIHRRAQRTVALQA